MGSNEFANPHITVTIHMGNDNLRRYLRTGMASCEKTGKGSWLFIAGYDNDKRELWQIPEVRLLCQRIEETGFGACLDVIPDEPHALGFAHVWLMARGLFKGKILDISDHKDAILEAYERCCARGNALLDQPGEAVGSQVVLDPPQTLGGMEKQIEFIAGLLA